MTEAAPGRRPWARWLPALAVVVAAVAGGIAWVRLDDHDPSTAGGELPPVVVTSDAPLVDRLDQLVAASDLVVRAQVVGTEEGRLFGDPGGGSAIRSRVVTLLVTRVLHGAGVEPGGRLLVEEEGWTLDGAPLVVDGLAPSRTGDDAVWFLAAVGAEEGARHVVVSSQGRYRVDGDALEGADRDDPLIAGLEALGAAGLEAAVTALG